VDGSGLADWSVLADVQEVVLEGPVVEVSPMKTVVEWTVALVLVVPL
jgi:hypothetical protein